MLPGEITRPSYQWRPENALVSYGAPFEQLAKAHIERLGCSRVMLIVSGSLQRNNRNEVEKLEKSLGSLIVTKRVGMLPHSDWQETLDVTEQGRDHNADLVLTLGGGSIIDAAKVVIYAMNNPSVNNKNVDSIRLLVTGGSLDTKTDVQPAKAKLICIPTTLSAGEYSGFAACADGRDHKKHIFAHPSITPSVVILDAKLCHLTPDEIWLSTGVRAMDHCIELLCRIVKMDEEVDDAAKNGIVLLTRGLLQLKHDRDDEKARLDTLIGGCYSMDGICKRVPPGASHAIGHALGGLGVPHGVTSCIMSPAVMKYNKRVNSHRQDICKEALWSDPIIAKVMEDRACFKEVSDLGDCLDTIFREFGVPRALKEVGFDKPDEIWACAENTLPEPFAPTNPIPLVDPKEVQKILLKAL